MKILVINPSPSELEYSFYGIPEYKTQALEVIKSWQIEEAQSVLERILKDGEKVLKKDEKIDVIAVRAAMGGTEFKNSVIATQDVKKKLTKLFAQAPMHLPMVVNLLNAVEKRMKGVPVVLSFDSGFFAELPQRETIYGMESSLARKLNLRRYGYHGLFHKAAAQEYRGNKIISICLEPRPEVAAILDGKAIMVTSGATPIEGIPGQKNCGDIDASIVLALAEKKKLSPEQINIELTENSGIKGLAGQNLTIKEVFERNDDKVKSAAEIILYRILLACGMSISAMGGVERIIFTGRYADTGKLIEQKLQKKLGVFDRMIKWTIFSKLLIEILAEDAVITILRKGQNSANL